MWEVLLAQAKSMETINICFFDYVRIRMEMLSEQETAWAA